MIRLRDEEPEALVVIRHEDGRVTAESFPRLILVSYLFFEECDPKLVTIETNRVTLKLSNGIARYERAGESDYSRTLIYRRIYLKER